MPSNKAYFRAQAPIIFGSEVGDDVNWSTEGVVDGAGQQSDQYDLGDIETASRPILYAVRFKVQLQATGIAVGKALRLYAKTALTNVVATAWPLNDDGLGDAAVSSIEKLRNLIPIASVDVDEAVANTEYVLEGRVELVERFVQLVFWNASGASVTIDVSETKGRLLPFYPDLQALAV